MPKIIIDIPKGLEEAFNHEEQWTALLCADMRDALQNSTPLDDIKAERYNQGFYDGYKKATEQANAVIDDIKAELKEMADSYNWHYDAPRRDTLKYAILVIDKHIGKNKK